MTPKMVGPTAAEMLRKLRTAADPGRVAVLQSFFKTGPGQYGEGDTFLGVSTPALRALCRECRGAPLPEIDGLLASEIHEARTLALLLLVDAFQRGSKAERRSIYDFYLAHTARINNWDLVDCSAAQIVGGWLEDRSRAPLRKLARSASLWERRIAIIATLFFIKRLGEFQDTFDIADLLLADTHDLIHKATGWMLREVGNKDGAALRDFLAPRYDRMPRTMLRYAIEKFPEPERKRYLSGRISAGVAAKSSSPRKSGGAKRKPKP
jgi:3-methyladenine DNA glycosylase AlkD